MFPLDFEEFLLANGMNDLVISSMRKKFERQEPLDQAMHDKIMDLFRKYLLVGGLPDAVNSYLAEKNIQRVREIQQEIGTSTYTVWTEKGKRFIHALSENGFNTRKAIRQIKGETAMAV